MKKARARLRAYVGLDLLCGYSGLSSNFFHDLFEISFQGLRNFGHPNRRCPDPQAFLQKAGLSL